jgi:F-type H+-transporting ATPase subunit delta
MPNTAIAQRYALALMEIADEVNAIDQILADLEHFSALMAAENGMLAHAFANPGITKEERVGLLDAVFGLFKPHEQSRNALSLLNFKGRLNHCASIASAFRRLADDRAGRVSVLVETAEPLTPELEIEIKEALKASTGKEIILEKRHVPELIGGLVAHVGSKVIDSSLRTHLSHLRTSLLRASGSSSS